jgi:hypothetical protein
MSGRISSEHSQNESSSNPTSSWIGNISLIH